MNINLNINKDGLAKLQKQFNNLTEISKKYANLGYEKSNKIYFREPINEQEEEFIKKVNFKAFLYLFIITFIFLVFFVVTLLTESKIAIKIIMGLLVLGGGFFTYKTLSTKELMIGKAIYKERKRNTSSKNRAYNYYVTVIDEENKLIYTRVQISKNEFEMVEEGTPILISKGSSKGYIYD